MLTRDQLAENLRSVEERLEAACLRAGRERSRVRLVAVTKLHPVETVRLAFELGLRDFGENYAQELRDKSQALAGSAGLRWHAIGPVQLKNAKYVAKSAHVFHALERLEIAQELSKRRLGEPLQCLIEVNLAGESSKAGVAPDEVPTLVEQVRRLAQLELVGLTAMPPLVEAPEENRPHFRRLAALARSLGLGGLSMGTTGDFEVAVEEGATWVRVGTALFGERPALGA